MKTGVYQIRNVINNHCYIGSTTRKFYKRKSEHLKELRNGGHHSIILQNAWNKYGKDNLVFEILEECSPENCIEREQFYLDTLKPKYNIRIIAKNNFGIKHSNKTRKKLSEKQKGCNNSFYGKHHTLETKLILRNLSLNVPIHSEEYKEKLKLLWKQHNHPFQKLDKHPMIGKHHTEQSKLKNSLSQKGKPKWTVEQRKQMSNKRKGINSFRFGGYYEFENVETKEKIISSKFELSDKYNLDRSAISKICNGKIKNHKKWICIRKVD